MIGILDFISFPFLNKYIKRYIHSFIHFEHHLLSNVHRTLHIFYSLDYKDLIKIYNPNIFTLVQSYNFTSNYYTNYYKELFIKECKHTIDSINQFLVIKSYSNDHPLHIYLYNLWKNNIIDIYYNIRFHSNVLHMILHNYKYMLYTLNDRKYIDLIQLQYLHPYAN
jgi:hypothetical protein